MLQFKLHSIPLKEAINGTKLEPLITLNNTLIDAVGWFGVSEHYARQAERSSLIKDDSRAEQCQALLKWHNETGLQIFSRVKATLEALSAEFGKERPSGKDEEVNAGLKRSLADLKTIVTDFDIKPSDAEKIGRAINEVDLVIEAAGHSGVIKLLQQKLFELGEFRSRPDRGAVENIPWWKLAAIVAAVGIWVIALIHCGWFGCSVDWSTAYAIGFNIAAYIAYFC